MHQTFWESYPDLAPHELIVSTTPRSRPQQRRSPRFDWDSARREVARRTMQHLQGTYGVNFPAPGAAVPRPAATRRSRARCSPTLQSASGRSSARWVAGGPRRVNGSNART